MNIVVVTTSATATTGTLKIGTRSFDCTLGRTGIIAAADKKEEDGKTPTGDFPLRQLIYRADRVAAPLTGLPVEILTPETGWCEDPSHADYNKKITLITLPHPTVHDKMTREDHLYDYVIVVGHNDHPVEKGKGSAIFIHLAAEGFTPTQGCVGLKREDMLVLLGLCSSTSRIMILPPP